MKLIVGLGNPGREYENTRHNVGFSVIDNYITTKNLGSFKLKFNGLFIKAKLFNEDVIFLKPQSYMNLSGEVVRKYADFYKINVDEENELAKEFGIMNIPTLLFMRKGTVLKKVVGMSSKKELMKLLSEAE